MSDSSSKLLCPKKVRWRRSLEGIKELSDYFSKKKIVRIRVAGTRLIEAGYSFSYKPLTSELLIDFEKIYAEYLTQMPGGKVYNIIERLENKMKEGKKYEMITLYHGDTLKGGLIYRMDKNKLAAAYKAFPDIPNLNLPIGISYIVEKFFLERALELEHTHLSHGKDTNGFGYYHIKMGLASFKMSFGFMPLVADAKEPDPYFFLDTIEPPTKESLFMVCQKDTATIKKAVLYTSNDKEEAEKKYPMFFEHLDIEIRKI